MDLSGDDRGAAAPAMAEQLSLVAEQNWRRPALPVWEREFTLIAACLAAGNDRALQDAVHRLARHNPPAARALESDIEFAATHRTGWPAADRGVLRLMALPLFVCCRASGAFPRALILPAAVRNSLSVHRLLDPASEDFYLLSPDLYDPEQLQHTGFSELHALTRQLGGSGESRHWLKGRLFCPPDAAPPAAGDHCVARYLLGGWITPQGVDPTFECPYLDAERRAWRLALAAELGHQLNATVTVGDARPFFSALRQRAAEFQREALRMRLQRLLALRPQGGAGLTAVLAVQGHRGRAVQVHLGLFADGMAETPLLAHAWPLAPEESAEEVEGMMALTLRQCGIRHVRVRSGILPPRRCGRCGEPLSVSPAGRVLTHAMCVRRPSLLH